MKNLQLNIFIFSVCVIAFYFLPIGNLFAQTDGVSIDYSGSPAREPKAIFQTNSTEQGVILPRMLATERTAIAPPASAQGMVVYQTDAPEGYYYWDGTQWLLLSASTGGGYIEDLAVNNAFGTGQTASYDITGNAEIGGTLEVSGNVGIGTTTPGSVLDVESPGYGVPETSGLTQTYGGMRISPPSSSGNVVLDLGTGGGTNGAWLQTTLRTNLANTYPLSLNPNGGNVGIGVLAPDEKLHVEGEVLIDLYQQGDESGIFFRQGFSASNKFNLGLLIHDDGDGTSDALDIAAFDGIYLNTGSNNRNPRLVVDSNGAIHVGPRASNNANARAVLIEKTATAGGEASGRIMFTEHNLTSAAADLYGFSIQYSGNGVGSVFPSGATTLLGNAGWGFVGHDNNLDGSLIMSGFRNSPNVQFYGSIDLANGGAVNEFSTDGTMGGNSNAAVPTEAAVVTYVGNQISASDEWTLNGNDLYPNSTAYQVGIGNTNPGTLLDITGAAQYQLHVTRTGNVGEVGIEFNSSDAVAQTGYLTFNHADAVSNTNVSSFHFNTTEATMGVIVDVEGGFYAGTDLALESNGNSYFNGGNVGIGIAVPTAELHIENTDAKLIIEDGAANNSYIALNAGNAGSPQIELTDNFGDMSWAIGGDDALNSFKIAGVASGAMPTINNNNSAEVKFTIETGGNIGIGIVDPTAQLHTTGSVRFAGVPTTATNTQILTRDANGNLAYRAAGSWTYAGVGDNLGNHTATATLVMGNRDITGVNLLQINDPGEGIDFAGGTAGTIVMEVTDDATDNQLAITGPSNLEVGIGTTTPAYELDVVGDIRARTNMYVGTGGGYFYNDAGSRVRINQDFYTNNANTYLYGNNTYLGNSNGDVIRLRDNQFIWTGGAGGIINTNGRVGIGTAAPATDLHIYKGGLGANTGVTDMLRIEVNRSDHGATPSGPSILFKDQDTNNGTNEARIKMSTVNDTDYGDNDEAASNLIFATTNGGTASDKMIITGRGNIGIGLLNPSYKLHVNGAIRTLAINETSDVRMKKDISNLSNSLGKVMKMRGVSYNWRTDEFPETDFENGLQYGMIAQELEKIIPELVETDSEGWKSIEYSHLVPLLIEAIKEQQAIINQQKATFKAELGETNSQLKSLFEKFQALELDLDNSILKATLSE